MNRMVYVGLDVHADTIAVAVAEDGRDGELRFFGVIPNTADSVVRRIPPPPGTDPHLTKAASFDAPPATP